MVRACFALIALVLLALSAWADGAESAGRLHWDRASGRVSADLQGWPLQAALERIAGATGWEVRVEPGLEVRVAARFERRTEREALGILLADVNFALLPATNGPTRLMVFRSGLSQATLAVRPPLAEKVSSGSTNALPRELIVRLKPGAKTDIHELARRLGARVAGSIDSLDAHRLIFDDAESAAAARAALGAEEDVAAVESNFPLGTPTRMEPLGEGWVPPLSLKARPVRDDSSVIVALLDTAIPKAGVAHGDFLMPGISVAGGAGTGAVEGGLTHGPAMFETILQGLAIGQRGESGQAVRVLPVDIYGGRGETSTFELAQGIAAALERGADILNLSLSGPSPSPLVHDLLQQASGAGVLTFGAPGNQPTTSSTYPAAYPEVVAVTASDRSGQVAPYANRGEFVDLIAPGTSVVPFAGQSWVVDGTSVSTAYASGLAAGLLADTGKSGAEVVQQMRTRLGFQTRTGGNPAP